MGTGWECLLRTLCYRQQNSHNPVFLTSQGSEQKKLHLLNCSLLMRKTFTSSHAAFTCVSIHLTQWHQREQIAVFQEIFPSHLQRDKSCRKEDGQDSAHLHPTQLAASPWRRSGAGPLQCTRPPQGREGGGSCLTVTLKLCGLHNPSACCLSPFTLSSPPPPV